MSTVADELLNDFGSSGDEADLLENGLETTTANDDGMELDGGDGTPEDEDMDDEETAKAKIEKMQFGTVKDVRSVAGLMATLEPILEVNPRSLMLHHALLLTPGRKLSTINRNQRRKQTSATSRITPNTTF